MKKKIIIYLLMIICLSLIVYAVMSDDAVPTASDYSIPSGDTTVITAHWYSAGGSGAVSLWLTEDGNIIDNSAVASDFYCAVGAGDINIILDESATCSAQSDCTIDCSNIGNKDNIDIEFTVTATENDEGPGTVHLFRSGGSAGTYDADSSEVTIEAGDVDAPTWDEYPANTTLEFNIDHLVIDFNATDADVGIDIYFINWTNNFTINSANGNLTNTTALELGEYYINVSVNDTGGYINSTVFTINVTDTIFPTWDEYPTNSTLEFNIDSLEIDFNATDYLLDVYFINWTDTFEIDVDGILTNSTNLSLGEYYINVSVNDTSNNINSTVFTINVTDTIFPTWDEYPTNSTLEFNIDSLSIDFNATDYSTPLEWAVNDTDFAIDGDGILTNDTALALGKYYLRITVNDTSENENFTIFNVNVTDTLTPTFDEYPANITITDIDPLAIDFNASDPSTPLTWFIDSLNINTSGLVSAWDFNIVGAYDRVGSNDGTINGTTWNATGGNDSSGAYFFDGVNDNIIIPNNPNLDLTQSFTLSAWINAGNLSSFQGILTKENGVAADRNFWFALWNDGKLALKFSSTSDNSDCNIIGDTDLRDTGWNYVAATYNGSECEIYLNGISQGSDPTLASPEGVGADLEIGDELAYPTRNFNGTIDEVMIFNRSLSATEISTIYNSTNLINKIAVNNSITINSTTGNLTNKTILNRGLYTINVSVNDSEGNTNSTIFLVTIGAGDTCDCSSIQAETIIDCTENCDISACDTGGKNMTFSGDGIVTISGDITNIGTYVWIVNSCEVQCNVGCLKIQ